MTASELQIATAESVDEKTLTLDEWLTVVNGKGIATQLGEQSNPAAFMRAALSSIRRSTGLLKCFDTPGGRASLMGSIMLAAQLHLEIGPALGYFHLTPREIDKDSNPHWECVPIIGYQGYAELAYRTERIDKVGAFHIRKGDCFDKGGSSERGEWYDWKPLDNGVSREPERVVAYAMIRGSDRSLWRDMTIPEIHARKPPHWRSTPWNNPRDLPQMERKTVFRALSAWLPKSADLGRALQYDGKRVDAIEGVAELVVDETPTPVEDETLTEEDVP